jgi:hypothetical protein
VFFLTTLFFSGSLMAKEKEKEERPECYAKIAWCTFWGGLTIKSTNVTTHDTCIAYSCQECEGVIDPEDEDQL